ncbi:acyl-ACP thioesterase domain-containing protein [Dolosicoccus paucivorans]|uniref:acyl-ACP thioesterase domain-containing protein n=1 Tax=Dolosicoccus paucivorans TaxID=84521 RepID=UPI0008917591|nr:acyl-ACP thioesterase domain-containing protein [Dolosicoccus paucivorans]SDI79283.1 Acyl-ACP thioesterase [Dolosicoccus paucivorans]
METLTLYQAVYPIDEGLNCDQLFSRFVGWGIQTSSKHDQYLRQQLNQEFLEPNQSWVITQNQLCKEGSFDATAEVTVTTRVTQANRFFIQRFYEYFQHDERIATMTTQFVAIDLRTRRLVRLNAIQKSLKDVIDPEYKRTLPQLNAKPQEQVGYQFEPVIEDGDIDVNNHVNNLIYLRWALDDAKQRGQNLEGIQQIDIKYSQELMADDQVTIDVQETDNITEYFIYKQKDQPLAAYIQLTGN